MEPTTTILLRRQDVTGLLTLDDCITVVEDVFRLHAEGKALPPKILGIHTPKGGFHIKAGVINKGRTYFAAKANSNFRDNFKNYGLPLIQGIIIVCDGENGKLLALIDSIEITILRTGAATGVAAKYLATADAKTATICGCGNQGRISLRALMKVRPIEKVFALDINEMQAQRFAQEFAGELDVIMIRADELGKVLRETDICVTCTPSNLPFLKLRDTRPGTFIAAVGADSEDKQELDTELLAAAKLVVDLAEQCANIGELHHALQAGAMMLTDVHAELGQIISGQKPGRTSAEEIIIFDSTGTALQDVVASALVYEKALEKGIGVQLDFAE